ncbi:hypothetical protein BV898_04525 [Hypsibius exemplaris]|uniref:Chitin-binding type-2 domain-containing protein n=1 Tax=Hypsibius exemplaris TaxID=2072580 RepID=A0A1W0X2F0_HYPEX|nr:hypothetical protein BV898_04525 [Hypsibius exemplaris]
MLYYGCLLGFLGVVACVQSEEEELERAFINRNRQLNQQQQQQQQQQMASSYGGNTVYYNPSQSQTSRDVCRGRTGYVADPSRNCQVFYNCMADGTVTTSTCPGNFQFDETSQCCKMPHDVNCAGLLDGGGLFQPTISCVGKRGFFPDLQSGCQVFYFCEPSGRSRQLSCPDGLLFNELIGCCDVVPNVNCGGGRTSTQYPPMTSPPASNNGGTIFCRYRQPGFYANPTDCSTYYYCQAAGQSSALRCPLGQAFNEKSSSCDNDLSRCYGVQVDSNVFDCTGRSGWYQGNDPNCRLAFYCNAGLGYQHSCPINQRWNTLSLSCDSPDRVPCGSDVYATPQPIARPQPLGPLPPNQTPIYSNIPGSPNYGGVPRLGYDYGINSARPATLPSYPYTPQSPAPGLPQTYPPAPVVITNTHLPPAIDYNNNVNPYVGTGNDFGTTTQRDAYSNPGLGIDNTYDCRGKIGYYAIQETGCSQFIYCNPEGIPHKFDCPSTLLFNNSLAVCDWPQNVHCSNQVVPGFLPNTQNPPNFDCRGKDGFFADQTRGGRIFYLCHADGIKYQYVCPSNLVFNEQTSVCDWPDYMKETGFVPRTPADLSQSVSVDWSGQPLDCRLRPAGFYAHPNNNQVYARCTPDGTFIPMRCPQTTVFDQALGQCVFPFQLGQGQTLQPGNPGTPGNSGALGNPVVGGGGNPPGYVPTTATDQTRYNYNPNTVLNFGAGIDGTGGHGTQGTNSLDGSGVNYAVQGGTYGQGTPPDSANQGGNVNSLDGSGVNYAVQGGIYGQSTATDTGTRSTSVNSVDGINYAVQNGIYGQGGGDQGGGGQGGGGQGGGGQGGGGQGGGGQGGGGIDQQQVPPPVADVTFSGQGATYGQGTNSYQTNGGGDTVNTMPNYAVLNGFYGRGTPAPPTYSSVPNYAVQTSFYGQTLQGTPTPPISEVPNYAVQTSFYGQTPQGTPIPPNYAVQNGFYGQSAQGTPMPPIVTSVIRPYNPQGSRTGFYQTTTPDTSYFNQIGGHNVPFQGGQSGYNNGQYPNNQPSYMNSYGYDATTQSYGGGNQIGYTYDSDNRTPYGGNQVPSSVPVSTEPRPGFTIGITIRANGEGGTPVVCIGRTGTFADRTNQCRSYTVCRADGTSETRTCSGNLVFSEQTGVCDAPQSTNCFANAPGIMQPSVPVCMNSGSSSGSTVSRFVPDTSLSCQTFYSCEQNGQGIGFRCPAGQQFNSLINACDDPRNCNCAAGNGGTFTVRIPVVTSQLVDGGGGTYNTAYSSNSQRVDQNINLDITLLKQRQLTADNSEGNMPLIPGYDTSLYMDPSTGDQQARLPTFYNDDESAPIMSNVSAPNHNAYGSSGLSQEQLLQATQQAAILQMAAAESARLFASKSFLLENSTVTTRRPVKSAAFAKPKAQYRGLRRRQPGTNVLLGNVLQRLTLARRSQQGAAP